ncbi:uncharacterized protein LOC132698472 [Cylas formicarius]|uniref:uncharacterized protein LOC132698472 n=1 Tax=Cylas formicarius TaxID=197179 RepID=UPI0029585453|nr:uncharacterized protein LOC132698472 [Cylas formicarius]XP_060520522.1 uncharacterized protein LOC132698472 [Cylas formicarius]XP_060520523.1 uncharacterized protein LOC132698472 [Cylas formicarius]
MSLACKKLWTALQILWSVLYVVCGACQLMVAIFFLISVSELRLYTVLFAGSWNITIGIVGGVVACIGLLSPKRQEVLLYLAVSILAVNVVALLFTEWKIYFAEVPKLLDNYPNHVLIDYACFLLRIAEGTVVVVSFFDSQFAFCSAQILPVAGSKKGRGSHDQVSDIEYIIPRSKPQSQQHQFYDAYAQSWVFDSENAGCSNGGNSTDNSYLIVQNGTTPAPKNPLGRPNGLQNGTALKEATCHLIDNPAVHVEEASDDSTSNSDRKLCYMKSFSRSTSPVILSASSSQISLNLSARDHNPPIYEYLEKLTEPQIYRSRLNTAVSSKEGVESPQYHAPQPVAMRRVETVSPQVVEPVQYASLMKELQKAIISKKEPSAVTSPLSNSESQSHSKSSDTEFSRELEAALQLIQDLESPNTAETPSDLKDVRPLCMWRKSSGASESEKTLSAVGSMGEITSPMTEIPLQRGEYSPSNPGKGSRVTVQYPNSQSTSGYSSPTHGPTPNWSTTSSINGSSIDIVKPIGYHIHNAKSTTVISLFSQASGDNGKSKSVTLVNISGHPDPFRESDILASTFLVKDGQPKEHFPLSSSKNENTTEICRKRSNEITTWQPKPDAHQGIWSVKSLLRKKKHNSLPKLRPELEAAIIKSESLAYLSEVELLARHKRNEEIQRQIEQRVIEQLAMPRSESHC